MSGEAGGTRKLGLSLGRRASYQLCTARFRPHSVI